MADDTSKTGGQDRAPVKAAGSQTANVERHLKGESRMDADNPIGIRAQRAHAVLVRLEKVYPWGLAVGRDLRDQRILLDHGTAGMPFDNLSVGQVLRVLPNQFGFAYWAGRA